METTSGALNECRCGFVGDARIDGAIGHRWRVLRKAHVDRGRISPFQAAALERFIEHRFVADADSGERDAEALEIAVALELAALDEFLADQQRRKAVARTVVHLVRHDLEAYAAFDRVV